MGIWNRGLLYARFLPLAATLWSTANDPPNRGDKQIDIRLAELQARCDFGFSFVGQE
jgi:hypothetical protein